MLDLERLLEGIDLSLPEKPKPVVPPNLQKQDYSYYYGDDGGPRKGLMEKLRQMAEGKY